LIEGVNMSKATLEKNKKIFKNKKKCGGEGVVPNWGGFWGGGVNILLLTDLHH